MDVGQRPAPAASSTPTGGCQTWTQRPRWTVLRWCQCPPGNAHSGRRRWIGRSYITTAPEKGSQAHWLSPLQLTYLNVQGHVSETPHLVQDHNSNPLAAEIASIDSACAFEGLGRSYRAKGGGDALMSPRLEDEVGISSQHPHISGAVKQTDQPIINLNSISFCGRGAPLHAFALARVKTHPAYHCHRLTYQPRLQSKSSESSHPPAG